jgi:hypothetical protein
VFLYHEDYSVNELSFGDACLLLEAAAEILVDPHAPLVVAVHRHQVLPWLKWAENVEESLKTDQHFSQQVQGLGKRD